MKEKVKKIVKKTSKVKKPVKKTAKTTVKKVNKNKLRKTLFTAQDSKPLPQTNPVDGYLTDNVNLDTKEGRAAWRALHSVSVLKDGCEGSLNFKSKSDGYSSDVKINTPNVNLTPKLFDLNGNLNSDSLHESLKAIKSYAEVLESTKPSNSNFEFKNKNIESFDRILEEKNKWRKTFVRFFKTLFCFMVLTPCKKLKDWVFPPPMSYKDAENIFNSLISTKNTISKIQNVFAYAMNYPGDELFANQMPPRKKYDHEEVKSMFTQNKQNYIKQKRKTLIDNLPNSECVKHFLQECKQSSTGFIKTGEDK